MPDTFASAAEAEVTPSLAARIDITLAGYNAEGIVRRVEHDGKVFIERTGLPGPDACRLLLAAGATGRLGIYRKGILQLTVKPASGGP